MAPKASRRCAASEQTESIVVGAGKTMPAKAPLSDFKCHELALVYHSVFAARVVALFLGDFPRKHVIPVHQIAMAAASPSWMAQSRLRGETQSPTKRVSTPACRKGGANPSLATRGVDHRNRPTFGISHARPLKTLRHVRTPSWYETGSAATMI